jgi:hypothetical protein
MSITQLTVANSDTLNKQLQLAGPAPQSKEYRRALRFLKQRVLLEAMEMALHDQESKELAIKNPKEFLLKNHIEIPEDLDIEFSLSPEKFKPMPGDYWFEIRMSNCRRFKIWDKKKKQPVPEIVCFEIKVIGKILKPSPVI